MNVKQVFYATGGNGSVIQVVTNEGSHYQVDTVGGEKFTNDRIPCNAWESASTAQALHFLIEFSESAEQVEEPIFGDFNLEDMDEYVGYE